MSLTGDLSTGGSSEIDYRFDILKRLEKLS
jgi:hypothetical protein